MLIISDVVSIPFKRERAWKEAAITGGTDFTDEVSIPFKRERAWKEKVRVEREQRQLFQFPSNGKGHGKSAAYETYQRTVQGFNSLQTGKGMES